MVGITCAPGKRVEIINRTLEKRTLQKDTRCKVGEAGNIGQN